MINPITDYLHRELNYRRTSFHYRSFWQRLHLDPILLLLLAVLLLLGLVILYSAVKASTYVFLRQLLHLSVAITALFLVAQLTPRKVQHATPWVFVLSLLLLLAVLLAGHMGKGAQRWLSLGILRFQPSELMRFTLPMLMAWMVCRQVPPITFKQTVAGGSICVVVGVLIAKQPDLGTAIMVTCSGFAVLFVGGLSWRLLALGAGGCLLFTPILWSLLHSYQKKRILVLLNPEHDPLGSGYHIIQSKIAIGSGGMLGKGWLNGTQTNLDFLPEHATDFIFAVCAEEFGFVGCVLVLSVVLAVACRALYLSIMSPDLYGQLLGSAIALTFFMSTFVNVGMISGILPVVGLPFPLLSYGGTSLLTTLTGFGLVMSMSTHRQR